jgi:hypothetical protein
MLTISGPRAARRAWSGSLLGALVLSSCVVPEEPRGSGEDVFSIWEGSECILGRAPAVSLRGAAQAPLVGCRAVADADRDVFQIQLVTIGTSGSFIQPGAGWLDLQLSFRQGSGQLAYDSPAGSPMPGRALVGYVPSGGGAGFALSAGSLQLDQLSVGGGGFVISGAIDGIEQQSGLAVSGAFGAASAAPVSLADSAAPANGARQGSAGCSDNGASCAGTREGDPDVFRETERCNGGPGRPPAQAACYCAAAMTYACFQRHGCYAEAGAPTELRRDELVQGRQTSVAQAQSVNNYSCNPNPGP